jgi:hypothetical protein
VGTAAVANGGDDDDRLCFDDDDDYAYSYCYGSRPHACGA